LDLQHRTTVSDSVTVSQSEPFDYDSQNKYVCVSKRKTYGDEGL